MFSYEQGNPVGFSVWGLGMRERRGLLGWQSHLGGNPGADIKSISHICYLREVSYGYELTKSTIHLPLGCLQGGVLPLQIKLPQ